MRIAYVISNVDYSLGFQWMAEELVKSKNDLTYILLNSRQTPLEESLLALGIPVFRIVDRGRGPFQVWLDCFNLIRKMKPQVVHCHLFKASLIGLSAAWLLRRPKRIHTRHHAIIHHQGHRIGRWLDAIINTLSTRIVAVSENVKSILIDLERVPSKKVEVIPNCFRLEYFSDVAEHRIEAVRQRWEIPDTKPVIGVVARYTEWKGIQFIIAAFAKLVEKHANAHLVLANAGGDYATKINQLLSDLPDGSFTEIAFESDSPALYSLFDLYVHVPVDTRVEAFGQTYIEALASGVPSIFTLSGVARNLIVENRNAIVVPFEDHLAIGDAMEMLLGDQEKAKVLSRQGQEDIRPAYSMEPNVMALLNLYSH